MMMTCVILAGLDLHIRLLPEQAYRHIKLHPFLPFPKNLTHFLPRFQANFAKPRFNRKKRKTLICIIPI